MTEIENIIRRLLTETSQEYYLSADATRLYYIDKHGNLQYTEGAFNFQTDDEIRSMMYAELIRTYDN